MKKRSSFSSAALNAPYTVWAAIFIVVPLFIVAYYSFTDSTGAFSLENIVELGEYKDIFFISVWYSVIATIIALLISYPFAYFLSKQSEKSRRLQMMLVMLPMWMNLIIRTYSWLNILEKNGIINNILANFGIEPLKMLGTPAAVIFGMVYNYLPYMILPIYTVMSKIEPSLLEAAEDLGCNGFNKLRRVIMPLSLPGVVSGITMVFVPSVSTFYISQILGNGKITLVGDAIESQIKSESNFNLGASLSLVLMIMIIISMAVMNKFSDDEGGMVI